MQLRRFATGPNLVVLCFLLFIGSILFGLLSLSLSPLSTAIQLQIDRNISTSRRRNWDFLPNKKVAVVQFVSAEKVEEFIETWPNHEERLMQKTQNSSLLLACPALDIEFIKYEVIEPLRWRLVEHFDHSHPFANGPLFHYKTLGNIDILLQPMNLHLPRHYLERPKIPTCFENRTWSLSYALYSGAVFSYHLIHLPVLKKFDYFLKVDTDIKFFQDMPFNIGEKMDEENCLVAHTEVHESNDCEGEALQAVLEAVEVLELPPPKSKDYWWCNENSANMKSPKLFYGNFLAFSTHNFLLHPHIQSISSYLYEEYENGYFVHRWGDQAPFIMYVCYMLDIPDIYMSNNTQLCDMTYLRHDVFEHI